MEELVRVNEGHAIPYGYDEISSEAAAILKAPHLLGPDCDVRFVLNGTGANVVSLASLLQPWEAVVCAESAHINVDEVGAPEHVIGTKLITIKTPDGKLAPELIEPALARMGDEHARQPRVISITNATEFGTLYTPEEVRAICDYAHSKGLLVHCDGARISNAVAAQEDKGVSLFDLTAKAGIDALSLGGTKNGMMGAEAVVLFGEAQHEAIFMIRKMNLMLSSKMRYVSAQFLAYYRDETWLEAARHANRMNHLMAKGLKDLGITLSQEPDCNEIFAIFPREIIKPLQDEFHFYTWDESKAEVRLVCSWDTLKQEVEAFLARIKELMS